MCFIFMFCLIFLKDIYHYLLLKSNFTFDVIQHLYQVHRISLFHKSGRGLYYQNEAILQV